jgi:hypothetical protein
VGPLFLAAGDTTELDKELDPEGCLAWLDARQPGSVVYVSFSWETHVLDAQLDEIVHGLVRSGLLENTTTSTSPQGSGCR